MKRINQLFFVFLIIAFSIPGYCLAASPEDNIINPDFWIHIDQVSDKYPGDSFVINGTTNIPAGETIHITTDITSLPHTKKNDNSVDWFREYTVPVMKGTGRNNTFTTPRIEIIPSRVIDGTLEKVRSNEYYILAEYGVNTSVYDSTLYNILTPSISQTATSSPVLSYDAPLPAVVPPTTPKKSPISPVLVMIAMALAGFLLVFLKRTG